MNDAAAINYSTISLCADMCNNTQQYCILVYARAHVYIHSTHLRREVGGVNMSTYRPYLIYVWREYGNHLVKIPLPSSKPGNPGNSPGHLGDSPGVCRLCCVGCKWRCQDNLYSSRQVSLENIKRVSPWRAEWSSTSCVIWTGKWKSVTWAVERHLWIVC